jgi:hypothetical protein
MSHLFSIELLPALDGECLWIEYGDPPDPHRILIDAGRAGTHKEVLRRIEAAARPVHFELIVITHVDLDHIGGVLKLLAMKKPPLTVGDIWFNGRRHLDEGAPVPRGPLQGEELTAILERLKLPWNKAFRTGGAGQTHAVAVPADGKHPQKKLPGGMTLTVLSPSSEKLQRLIPLWDEEVRKWRERGGVRFEEQLLRAGEPAKRLNFASLVSAPFSPDDSPFNGSSIAMLAEFDGRRALLGADAHPDLLLEGIRAAAPSPGGRLQLDAFKMPHHGSRRNLSREIVEAVDCPRFLVSTDGSRFGHPDPEALARVIKFGGERPELIFNYRTEKTLAWKKPAWMKKYGYSVRYLDAPKDPGKVIL